MLDEYRDRLKCKPFHAWLHTAVCSAADCMGLVCRGWLHAWSILWNITSPSFVYFRKYLTSMVVPCHRVMQAVKLCIPPAIVVYRNVEEFWTNCLVFSTWSGHNLRYLLWSPKRAIRRPQARMSHCACHWVNYIPTCIEDIISHNFPHNVWLLNLVAPDFLVHMQPLLCTTSFWIQ